jgi:hypothetical protein
MPPLLLRLFVERLPDKQIAKALLAPYAVEIDAGHTSSSAISHAVISLIDHPEQPVAVLFNSGTADPIEVNEERSAARRILARAAPENWYVAVAVPRLDAWAMTDPRIAQDLQAHLDGKGLYADRAQRIRDLTKVKPFDPTVLCRENADFRGLTDFLRQHAPAASRQGLGG